MDKMTETLIVLNNYFHDITVALVFVFAAAFLLIFKYFKKISDNEAYALALFIYSRLKRVFLGVIFFVIAGAIIRVLSADDFELADAARNNQMTALKAKYLLLATLFFGGMILWYFPVRKIVNRNQPQSK